MKLKFMSSTQFQIFLIFLILKAENAFVLPGKVLSHITWKILVVSYI